MVVFGQKWLYSVKRCCNRANVVVYGKIGFIPAKWLYFGKVVVFWQKWLYSGKSCCIRAKVAMFGQIGCIR